MGEDHPADQSKRAATTSDSDSVIRRDYLKGVGSALITTGIFTGVGSADDGDTVEIPWTYDEDGVREYKEVPKDWHDHERHSKSTVKKKQDPFLNTRGVKVVSRTRDSTTYAGKNGFKIKVGVLPGEYEGGIPESVNGIPVEVVEASPPNFGACGSTLNTDNIPGGVSTELNDDCTEFVGFGSLCTRVKDDNKDRNAMLTAAHLWPNCHSIGGDPAYHMGDKYGEVDSWIWEDDIATIKLTDTDEEEFEPQIYDPSTQDRHPVVGWFGEQAIASMIADGDTVREVGVTTGTTTGPVIDDGIATSWDDECIDYSVEGTRSACDFGDGDSGGPVFRIDNDGDAKMLHHNSWQTGTQLSSINCHPVCNNSDQEVWSEVTGIPMWHLDAAHNIRPS